MDAVSKRKLIVAAALLVMAVLLLLTAGTIRAASLTDDDGATTRAVRDATVRAILRAHPDDAPTWFDARQRLRVSVLRLLEEPYVSDVWLVRASGGGRISYASGGPGAQGDLLVDLSGAVGEAAKTTDAWATGGAERFVPLAVAAMSRDGDHRDVFRYLAEPVTFANGDGAVVVVRYDRTISIGSLNLIFKALLVGALVSLAAAALLAISAWRHGPRSA